MPNIPPTKIKCYTVYIVAMNNSYAAVYIRIFTPSIFLQFTYQTSCILWKQAHARQGQ